MIPEPRLTAELEDRPPPGSDAALRQTYADALRELATQLGLGNDYYFALIWAARRIDGKSARQRAHELAAPTN